MEIVRLEKDKEAEKKDLQMENSNFKYQLADSKTRLLKALGILNLRGAWECYERERSPRKARNPLLGRRETLTDLLLSKKFDNCFDPATVPIDKLLSMYSKLSNFVHSPELDLVIIESSKFDKEELCVIKVMLQDLMVQYEVWELGKMIEKYPPYPSS